MFSDCRPFVSATLYYVGPILLLIGALHVVVGYWAYQNLSEQQSNHLPGLNQLDTDYEIINFTNVGELVAKMKAGDWDAVTRGEYKIEVSDAAVQVIAEQTLRRCLAAIHLSKSNQINQNLIQKNIWKSWLTN